MAPVRKMRVSAFIFASAVILLPTVSAWIAPFFQAKKSFSRNSGITRQLFSHPKGWEKISQFVSIDSPWLKLIGERLKDDRGQLLDYWRIEKEDSAVIVTVHRDRLVFPKPAYRPGQDATTLDFPGGRVPKHQAAVEVVPAILRREVGLTEGDYRLLSLNEEGWPVNSSFSNQKLFGFVAIIGEDVEMDQTYLHSLSYALKPQGIEELLDDLTCLQCRAVLLEWLRCQALE